MPPGPRERDSNALRLDALLRRPPASTDAGLHVSRHPGPLKAATARPGVGLISSECVAYSARSFDGDSSGIRRARWLLERPRVLTRHSVIEYAVFPHRQDAELLSARACVAMDLELSDGSLLSQHRIPDQYGTLVDARSQGARRQLYFDQWNLRRAWLGELSGRTVVAVHLAVDTASPRLEGASHSGWIDAVRLLESSGLGPGPQEHPLDVADIVETTRGTHSGHDYSRGNTFPATCLPRGFNFYTPVTDASSLTWQYSYHAHNDEQNRPRLEAITVSHMTSRWIGDRASFQFLPWSGTSVPPVDRKQRSLPFHHDCETARPHCYSVECDDGTVISMAPEDHSLVAEVTFPTSAMYLVFDNITADAHLDLSRAVDEGVVTGWSDVRSDLSEGTTRMFVWGSLDTPVDASGYLASRDRPGVCGYVRHRPNRSRSVTLRLGTSFLSLEQAECNVRTEISDSDSVATVSMRAQGIWNDELLRVRVKGATPDQTTTLYSGLYRWLCYPNIHSEGGERTGTPERYASPYSPARAHSEHITGARVKEGRLYVNNGFWDTYRTCWPAYALLRPTLTAEMIDGFVQHYEDGGWMPRWSSPGYIDCMVGTSSDVVVADALAKGVTGFDAVRAYDASLRNATAPSERPEVGRKGQVTASYRGYVSTTTPEGLSWSLENAINDFGLMVQSEYLARTCKQDDPRLDEYRANQRYFADRARAYTWLFDESTGFFRGRSPDGSWREDPPFDPRRWGHDYTETNAWNMAFTVPHDPPGLVALHGGAPALEAKLDEFFSTAERGAAENRGSYDVVIHEMVEARDVGMGMFGMSNQPSHHIPFMYVAAGRPDKCQAIVREVLARLFVGSDLGQGYLGDEDNGEMSAWYFFAALGLYPLSVGSPYYVISSPLFRRMSVTLENGREVVVEAPNNSDTNVYIQGVAINGEPWPNPFVAHDVLVNGAVLTVDLGPAPSAWGVGRGLPGLTPPGERPTALVDRSGEAVRLQASRCDHPALAFNDTSLDAALVDDGGYLGLEFEGPLTCTYYTVTVGEADRPPTGWELEGSPDGTNWTTLDQRSRPVFRWDRQLRVFLVEQPQAHRFHRIVIHASEAASIAQVELYG